MKLLKLKSLLAGSLAGFAAQNLNGQTLLTEGHTDVGIVYESGGWNLHIGQHLAIPPMEYSPHEAILGVDIVKALTTVPAGSQWSFMGPACSSVWILPAVQNPDILFLGFGTEELASGLFLNDEVTLSLKAVRSPGQFAVYDVGMFGNPNIYMNSGDGITAGDSILLTASGHQHVNWAFSGPGTYEVDFEAVGMLVDGGDFSSSGPITYTFSVQAVPEPGTVSLVILGGAGMLAFMRRRNSCN